MSQEATTASVSPRLSGEGFKRLSQFVTHRLGIKMPPEKLPMVQSRLQRRIRQLGLTDLDAYCTYLLDSPAAAGEEPHFIDLITTNKTDFFREPQHFEYLVQRALPDLQQRAAPGPHWDFKLWCAGCSSGEEPYTLAMVLSKFAQTQDDFRFSILATDISTRKLHEAADGVYEDFKIEPVPMELRKKYLLRGKDRSQGLVRVQHSLRELIRFRRLNFMDQDFQIRETFEVIFFRNVMIYFDKQTQEAVVNKLCRRLRPGGYLFVGHSESLAGLNVPLQSVAAAVFRRNEVRYG